MMVWPVVYPKRPPDDRELIYRAVLPYFHARQWQLTAIKKAKVRKWRTKALWEVKYYRSKLHRTLDELPPHLEQRAIAICQTSKCK